MMTETSLRTLRGGKLLIGVLALLGGLLILGRLLSDLYVEMLWYRSTGYTSFFYRRLVWLWGLRLAWGAVVVVALVTSLRLVARTLGGIQIKRRFGNLEISEQLPRTWVWWGILGVSLLLGAWFGSSIPAALSWSLMGAVQGVEWGLREPVLGRDASFYVFVLPLLRTGVAYLLVLAFLVFSASLGGYAATGAVRWGRGGIIMGNQPRIHLGTLVAIFIALLGVRYWLARSGLLLSGNSAVGQPQGIFGYADAEARLPALRIMTVVTLAAAGAVMWGVWRNRLIPVVSGVAAVTVGSLVVLQFYPSLVQRFRVTPNELEWETPYIEHNLEFTRLGFALADMERRVYRYRPSDSTDWVGVRDQFQGLPVWPGEALLTNFRNSEARFPYYGFENVHVTRYPTPDGRTVPVAISVREIDPSGINEGGWQNLHLRDLYIRGMGAVASAAADRSADWGPPMYLSAIPPEFTGGPTAPQGLRLSRPAVYFGSRADDQRRQPYVIVNAGASALIAEEAGGVPGVDFPEGILLDSPLKKLALAWRFRDPNLLFSSEVNDSSRMVFRRGAVARAEQIAPFFRYLENPYPVIANGRIYWILEGFTATRQFPLARALDVEPRRVGFSYVRNSVKVTVDAVSGDVRFYALPEEDPLRDTYARGFPSLLRPIEEMPAELREHLRYSRVMLAIQGQVLLQYHQETARRFHEQQDVWARPEERFQSTNPVPYSPEYGIYRLPGEQEPTFNLTTAFVPSGRQNLTAVLVGRLDDGYSPELILFDVPVEDQALGPLQIEAMIEQHPEISQQFNLWRGTGSQVWTGHLHLVPVGSQLFYMEPVFLAANEAAIPELRRFIVSDGRRVSMEPTLDAAIAALAGERLPTTPRVEGTLDDPRAPSLTELATWPREALELLDLADRRLRGGDWPGFGAALEELRRMLEQLSQPGGER